MAEMKHGLFVADEAIRLALTLEARGHMLSVQDGALLVSSGSALTPEDTIAIRRWKWHLLAIAGGEDIHDTPRHPETARIHRYDIDMGLLHEVLEPSARQRFRPAARARRPAPRHRALSFED